jgi:hypothetical protein
MFNFGRAKLKNPPRGLVENFNETYDRFSQTKRPAWEEFGYDAPPILRFPDFVGYTAGRLAADYTSDATRERVWRWNALQAQTTDLGRTIGRRVGLNKRDSILAGFALTNAVELASGNIDLTNLDEAGRPQGYRTIFPVETETIDPKTGEITVDKNFLKSRNIPAEFAARYFLGRTGSVLPWDQFKTERPDVTPEQYARVMRQYRDRTLFGLEDRNPKALALAGTLIGGAAAVATKKPMPLVQGAVGGYATPGTADVLSELGVVTGTRESFDDPVGEMRIFGYRVPIAKVGATIALTTGVGVAGKKLWDSGLLKKTEDASKIL